MKNYCIPWNFWAAAIRSRSDSSSKSHINTPPILNCQSHPRLGREDQSSNTSIRHRTPIIHSTVSCLSQLSCHTMDKEGTRIQTYNKPL